MKLFIDTDTASDDAVALIMAMMHSEVELIGITTVAGNVPIEMATQNALYIRELCESAAPIVRGAAAPLTRPLETAQWVHGDDGMGDIGLPLTGREPDRHDAVDFIVDSAGDHAGELVLVTLGPLTNVALALGECPRLAGQISRCVVMGGTSDGVGNVSPVGEFNIWADPDAADVVFSSELPIEMVGWDISRHYAVITPKEEASLRRLGTDRARVAVDCQRVLKAFTRDHTKLSGFDLPDPIAMAIALNPQVGTRSLQARIHVDTSSGPGRGHTRIDTRDEGSVSRAKTVFTEADRALFMKMLTEALS